MAYSVNDILTITQGGILYRDQDQIVRWIDFAECNRNWLASRRDTVDSDEKCVGWRNTGDGSVLDVEFFTEPRTRFEFISYRQRDRCLLNPMRERGGWHTWDLASKPATLRYNE